MELGLPLSTGPPACVPGALGLLECAPMLGPGSSFVSVCGPRLSQMLWELRATRSEHWRPGRVMSFVPDKGLKGKHWRVKCSAGNGGWSQRDRRELSHILQCLPAMDPDFPSWILVSYCFKRSWKSICSWYFSILRKLLHGWKVLQAPNKNMPMGQFLIPL